MSVTTIPILYSFRRCPYAMRARMALAYSNIKVELREVDLKNKPDELLTISPKATVPVLILPDENKLEESLDIIYWSLSIQDSDGWNDLNDTQKKLANLLITQNDTEFKLHLDKYKYSQRFPENTELYYRQQGEQFLSLLNEYLGKSNYLIKDELSVADIAIVPFIRQFSNVDINWFKKSKYQFLVKWLDEILDSTIFNTAMRKFTVWEAGDDKNIFP